MSLTATPHDVLLRIVALLDVASCKSLALCHPNFVEACRIRIHRTVDTSGVSGAALERLTSEPVLAVVAANVRRLRASFNWRHLEKRNHLPSAAEVDVFLLQRDELLAKLLTAASSLRVLTVELFFESPYSTSYVDSQLDRLSLTRFVTSLAQFRNLWTLKIDFALPQLASHFEHALAFPLLFMQQCAPNSFAQVKHLSIANVPLHTRQSQNLDSEIRSTFSQWIGTFTNLRYLQLDGVICRTTELVSMLPGSLEGLEVIQANRSNNVIEIFTALELSKLRLRYMRIVAFRECWEMPSTVAAVEEAHRPIVLQDLEILILGNASRAGPADNACARAVNQAFQRVTAPKLAKLVLPPDHKALPCQIRPLIGSMRGGNAFPSLERIRMPCHQSYVQVDRRKDLQELCRASLGAEFEVGELHEKEAWTFASAFARLE